MLNISPKDTVRTKQNTATTIRLKAFDGDCYYRVDLDTKQCECRQFKITERCDHLAALGIFRLKPFTPTTHPTFSQGLSALVKSIRLRLVEDAAYWLVYLDTFKEPQYRFRTARRILIASAEDGHSVAVMEEVVRRFWANSKPKAELTHLMADAQRICKLPNWWHPDSGGPDYVYSGLVGRRQWLYKAWDHKLGTLQREVQKAIAERDPITAIGGVLAFDDLPEKVCATRQAEFLLAEAQNIGHELAARLCKVHLSARSALSSDNNFLCQAAWMLAGGVSPIADETEQVTEECHELLERAKERWRNPQPAPRYLFDGVHSAGDDPRFMGTYPAMHAVCRAFQHYGRVSPDDLWLPQFRCLDGLVIEPENMTGERE